MDPDTHGSVLKLTTGSGSVFEMQTRIHGMQFNKAVQNNGCKTYIQSLFHFLHLQIFIHLKAIKATFFDKNSLYFISI